MCGNDVAMHSCFEADVDDVLYTRHELRYALGWFRTMTIVRLAVGKRLEDSKTWSNRLPLIAVPQPRPDVFYFFYFFLFQQHFQLLLLLLLLLMLHRTMLVCFNRTNRGRTVFRINTACEHALSGNTRGHKRTHTRKVPCLLYTSPSPRD